MPEDHRPARAPAPLKRDWWVIAGMAITAVAAAISSFSGLRSLAELAGWPQELSPLLPVTIDAYAMTATRVWLAPTTTSQRARRFARANAVGAIAASLAGNAAYHAIAAGVLALSWPIVVLVGAVPPTILGLLSHLAVLRTQDDSQDEPVPAVPTSEDETGSTAHRTNTETRTGTTQKRTKPPARTGRTGTRAEPASGGRLPAPPPTGGAPDPRLDPELVAAARAADAAHRDRTQRPITRDALRAALGVSTNTATALLRHLREATGTGEQHTRTVLQQPVPRTGTGQQTTSPRKDDATPDTRDESATRCRATPAHDTGPSRPKNLLSKTGPGHNPRATA